ncbi:MAG: caspase family protein [Bacteroidales bacterium]|nr:caspase family protein [Bacteroidales bacterium]MBN2817963.1 caspase family protein [Bacteroidales bacterium]
MKYRIRLTILSCLFLTAFSFSQQGEGDFKSLNLTKESNPAYRGDPLKGLNVAGAIEELKFGKFYALIIGIDKYSGNWVPLSNAVNDAKTIEAMLKEKYQFDKFISLYNEQASRMGIMNAFEGLLQEVNPEDNLFIFYSGHGEYKEELDKGYWVPYGARSKSTYELISNSDIQTFLKGIPSKHTLLVSDACFSGDIFRGNTTPISFEDSEKYYAKVNELSSRKAITSGGVEPVLDGGKDGHSVFAFYLLRMLNQNDKKYIDASQIYEGIRIPVQSNSSQTPQFQPIHDTGDEGGQFIFIKKD